MADPNVADYIKSAIARGDSREKIRSDFISSGWTAQAAEQALDDVLGQQAKTQPADAAKKGSNAIFYLIIAVILILIIGTAVFIYSNAMGIRDMIFPQEEQKTQARIVVAAPELPNLTAIDTTTASTGVNESLGGEVQQQSIQNAGDAEEVEFTPLKDPCINITCTDIIQGIGGPPSIAWTGSEYGLVWNRFTNGQSRLYFARISKDGKKAAEEAIVKSYDAEAKKPSIVWTGFGYGIVWPVGNALYFMQLGKEGNIVGDVVDVTTYLPQSVNSSNRIESASIAWTGSLYGIAWGDINSKSYFMMLDSTGNKVGNISGIGMTSSQTPLIVWSNLEYGIAWVENKGAERKVYLSRFDIDGNKLSTIRIDDDYILCDEISLSFANSNYGIAYSCIMNNKLTDRDDREVYFMRIHSTGGITELISLDQGMVKMTEAESFSRKPSLVLSENNYGIFWEEGRDGNSEIYFGRIFVRTGTKKEDEVRLTNSDAQSLDPFAVYEVSEYGVVWTENKDNQTDIFFGRVE